MMRYFDAHTHPNCEPLDKEFPAIYEQCQALNLAFNVVGNNLADSAMAVAMAAGRKDVVCTIGIHPTECDKYDLAAARQQLEAWLQADYENKIVAIGECGFDLHYAPDTLEIQKAFFQMQIDLAIQYNKTLMCHIRDAHALAYEVLKAKHPDRVIIHCFTEDAAVAEKYCSLGFYLSIPGIVTFKNAQALRDALHVIPQDRILVETDAPFLAPVPYRGKTNYPYYVIKTLEAVAQELAVPVPALAEQVWQNTLMAFALEEDGLWHRTTKTQ